ncbi:hypothetical protein NDA03_18210 [Trichocoleus sp. Lan]|uniref:hypothetical protein n=1 Tax=Trichocoleus sp. Lan TaxID=2933927 RepID=UPI0032969A12
MKPSGSSMAIAKFQFSGAIAILLFLHRDYSFPRQVKLSQPTCGKTDTLAKSISPENWLFVANIISTYLSAKGRISNFP